MFFILDLINDKLRKINLTLKRQKARLVKNNDKNSKKPKLFKEKEEEIKELKLRHIYALKNIESLR
jgi:hypothetical protein